MHTCAHVPPSLESIGLEGSSESRICTFDNVFEIRSLHVIAICDIIVARICIALWNGFCSILSLIVLIQHQIVGEDCLF